MCQSLSIFFTYISKQHFSSLSYECERTYDAYLSPQFKDRQQWLAPENVTWVVSLWWCLSYSWNTVERVKKCHKLWEAKSLHVYESISIHTESSMITSRIFKKSLYDQVAKRENEVTNKIQSRIFLVK